jgi:hypothetical protein
VADDPDDSSPWTRDDWVSDSSVPDAVVFADRSRRSVVPGHGGTGDRFDAASSAGPDDGDPSSSTRPSVARRLVAAGIVVALLVGSAGALLRGSDDADAVPTTTSNSELPSTTAAAADDTPVTAAVVEVTVPSSPGAGEGIELADPIAAVVVGEPPRWTERMVEVPAALTTVAATEVITLTQSGIVNVTEFPSGRTRSLDVSALGAQAQLAVDDATIVVFNSTSLLLIRDAEPVIEVTLADSVVFVEPWTGTGNFVVTSPSLGPDTPSRDWLLNADGTTALLENPFVGEVSFFSRRFSADGDALVTAPGGVYAIGADGTARRISTGNLLATGREHWAIEECDESLRCAFSIIEWESGTVTAGVLDQIVVFGYIDPATRLSPDGRSISFRADTDGSGRRAILDVEDGTTVPAGRINQLVYPDSWAMDSSGLFITDRFLQFVDRATGTITEIDGLDRMRTVATRPVPPAPSP